MDRPQVLDQNEGVSSYPKSVLSLARLLSILVPISASASQFYPVDLNDAIASTPSIVRAKVIRSYSDWGKNGDGSTQLFTYTELSLTESLKGGELPEKIIVREIGGEKDGVSLEISGTARFKRDEDVVLFLGEPAQDRGEASYPIQNMMMGKLEVQERPNGDRILKGPAIQGASVGAAKSLTLAEFKQRIENPAKKTAEPAQPQKQQPSRSLLEARSAPTTVGKMTVASSSPTPTAVAESENKNGESNPRQPSRFLIYLGAFFGLLFYLRARSKKRS